MKPAVIRLFLLFVAILVTACGNNLWNNPYPVSETNENILYSAFSARPKHLDPVQSYSENEYEFIAQIYQPPLQYHYLKRPYQLIPFAATEVPKPKYFSANNHELPENSTKISYTVYEIRIKPGIYYQPHPALAKDASGKLLYHNLTAVDLAPIHQLSDFRNVGSRELVAEDYVYQIKRLCHPRLHSPIYGLMSGYIIGLKELAEQLRADDLQFEKNGQRKVYLDLRQYSLSGAEVIDRYRYTIRLRGKYPQFNYWLAMSFFAPIPQEADHFYSQPGMAARNLTLDWYPIGTGPYMLTVNDPNRKMVLERNPNYKGEVYPSEGEREDSTNGLLRDAGKPLPFIDKVVFSLEKEGIPYWNKFLQGYYDASGIQSDNFDQAINIAFGGEVAVTDDIKRQGIGLSTAIETSTSYMGFNMLDDVVGGHSERARKLRLAVSIAIDYEEFISIFLNDRGVAAQSPIAPGIFGYKEGRDGINPYVYDWVDGKAKRKSIDVAKKLLAEAGYPNGRDEKTGTPLLLYLDTTGAGLGEKSRLDWLKKQLDKINIQLVDRSTDYNRFQDKIRKGSVQLFNWGWNADYPDPENFLFLLYGPEGKLAKAGENAANYDNPAYDRLFDKMKHMSNTPERQLIIDQMMEILRHDSPWLWGFHPKKYALYHEWVYNRKPLQIGNNGLKYQRIDPLMRAQKRSEWNRSVVWPVLILISIVLLGIIPAIITHKRRERNIVLRSTTIPHSSTFSEQ